MADSFRIRSGTPISFCVRLLTVCEDGKIFLVENEEGCTVFPGGAMLPVDKGNPANTAIRNLKDETGIILKSEKPNTRLIQICTWKKDITHMWLCYRTVVTREEYSWHFPRNHEGEVMRLDPQAVLNREVKGLRLPPLQRELLKRHVAGTLI